jgi:hypothetical protein
LFIAGSKGSAAYSGPTRSGIWNTCGSRRKRNRILYEKFLFLWRNADTGLPEVEDTRKRVDGLKNQ